ncbi:type IIL restriction-modification enzyme MmeI, partial [Streptomyces sp. NPDC006668]|uniref:type IIL restriction-modification enzyme MmeI n=1 Tax=Streptomyces sp. NPDC006668 TaxID=3156903 RepID=UPI0033C309A7
PVRLSNNRKVYRDYWWQYAEKRPAMLAAIEELDRVLVVARVSKTCLPVFAPTGQVISEAAVIFATNSASDLALLSSGVHYLWANAWGSSLKGDLRYTPSDVFETFPQPAPSALKNLTDLGSLLNERRSAIMLERNLGLTQLYNRFHDPASTEREITELRGIHTSIDRAVMSVYEWDDLDLDYTFQRGKKDYRRIFNSSIQAEILDRLLELNHACSQRRK